MSEPQSAKKPKISLLKIAQDELGFESRMDMLEEFALEGVVPGVCRNCHTVSGSNEPDATENWCSECEQNKVVSILILAGLV